MLCHGRFHSPRRGTGGRRGQKPAADKAKKIQLAKEITKKLKQGNQKTTKTDLTKAAVKEKMKLVKSSGTNKKVVSKNIK